MANVYFIAVNDMDGMIGREAKRIPFECEYSTVADLEAALRRGGAVGSQLIYDPVPGSFPRKATIRRRVAMRLTLEHCGAIRESTLAFVDPEEDAA